MKGLIKTTIVIISLLNFYSNIFAKDGEALSHKDIMEGIVAMNLYQAQKFCKNIKVACNLIDQTLTNIPKNNFNFKIQVLLEIFSSSSDYRELREFQLCSIEDQSLTLRRYLQFSMAMTLKRKLGSFSLFSYDNKTINKFQKDLEIQFSASEENLIWLDKIKDAMINPLDINPYNICSFNMAFKNLLENSSPQLNNSFIQGEITYRNIADKLISMSHGEMRQFSQKVFEATLRVQEVLTPYSNLNSERLSWYSFTKFIDKSKNLIQAFNSFQEELNDLRNFKIWQFGKHVLSLESYLQFFIDMHPHLEYQAWIPLLKSEKYRNEEQILSYFGLNLNSQYALIVRQSIAALQSDLNNPFGIEPLDIAVLKSHFQNLKEQSEESKNIKSSGEEMEDFIRSNASYIGGSIASVGGTIALLVVGYYKVFNILMG